jgi:hypothetical protein
VHVAAAQLEHLLENEEHHEEGRPHVELEVAELDSLIAAPDDGGLLEHLDFVPVTRQQHGGGQPTRSGSDDDDLFALHVFLRSR